MKNENLRYLERRWLVDLPAERALRTIASSSEPALLHLLRDHRLHREPVPHDETIARDAFDGLLWFYSVVEIALTVGFVKTLPAKFVANHLPVLLKNSLRTYYEWHYPLDLPRRLRERMFFGAQSKKDEPETQVEAFFTFLELSAVPTTDSFARSFLWLLDDGQVLQGGNTCDLHSVIKVLEAPSLFAEAMLSSDAGPSEAQKAAIGFSVFVEFCLSLDHLLLSLSPKKTIAIAEAMWLGHAYWFRQFQGKLGSNLQSAVHALGQWTAQGADQETVISRVQQIEECIQRLSVPPTSHAPFHLKRRKLTKTDVGTRQVGQAKLVSSPMSGFSSIQQTDDPSKLLLRLAAKGASAKKSQALKVKKGRALKGDLRRTQQNLDQRIMAAIKSSESTGVKVADLAKELGLKSANLHAWFATTGKLHTQKIGRGRYRLKRASA